VRNGALSKLITGRAGKHLRQAVAVISAAACILVGTASVLEWQYIKAQNEFLDNPLVHFVDVMLHAQGNSATPLSMDDVSQVSDTVDKSARGGYQLCLIYNSSFGLQWNKPDKSVDALLVFGISAGAAWSLGLDAMQDGVAYTDVDTARFDLDVPQETKTDSGWGSDSSISMVLPAEQIADDAPVALYQSLPMATAYVSEATFGKIVSEMFGQPWDTLKAQTGADSPFGLSVIDRLMVHLDDLSDLKPVALALEDDGYSPFYVLGAFQDISGTLQMGLIVGGALVLLCLVIGPLISISLIRGYLCLSHKDMGILRHIGYTSDSVQSIYALSVGRLLLLVEGVAVVVTVAAAFALSLGWLFGVGNVAAVSVMIGVVAAWALAREVGRHAGLPVLDLLKRDREFE